MKDRIRNGVITGTKLGITHGLLVGCIYVKYKEEGGSQGYVTNVLQRPDKPETDTVSIIEILDTVGVKQWEDLIGQPVRVYGHDAGLKAIGNLLDAKWYSHKKGLAQELVKKYR